MAGPSPAQLGAVRTLIETAPEAALRSLERALAGVEGGPMAQIQTMVAAERDDRNFRGDVFAPVIPLFGIRAGGLAGPQFPNRVLTQLWNQLKACEPDFVVQAQADRDDWRRGDDPDPRIFNVLCAKAARMLRAEPDSFFRAADRSGPLAQQLAAFLDLAPLARVVLARLPDWLGRATEERVAVLKLIFKDAVDVAIDATPRLLELVLAHLPEPQAILRMIAALTDRASDRFLASSELASLGERLLDDVDLRIAHVKAFNAQAGIAGARAVAHDVTVVCAILAEMEQSVDLARDGPWGSRVNAARKALALNVESRLRDIEGVVAQALPLQNVRIAGRMTRPAPKLAVEPDLAAVDGGRALLVFLEEVRPAAAAGGYGALRNAVAEKVTERLNVYADELLHAINAGEAPDQERAQRFLEIAAEYLGYAADAKAAQIVRRRAAVAGDRQPSQDVA
jgi:hypothetical protein